MRRAQRVRRDGRKVHEGRAFVVDKRADAAGAVGTAGEMSAVGEKNVAGTSGTAGKMSAVGEKSVAGTSGKAGKSKRQATLSRACGYSVDSITSEYCWNCAKFEPEPQDKSAW
ncbi:MAG: hypothetical protein K6G50_06640 [bacterium]|nr:hypothetical protein [bacterium]